VVSQYALAYPEVRFALYIDGRESLKTPGTGNLADSISAVYGVEIASNMLEVSNEQDGGEEVKGIRISGMVGSPRVSRSSRNYISLFVNRRWVSNRRIIWAIEEAYHGLLMTGKYPVAVINIDVPLADVDSNVHPTKTEVRFRDENGVYVALQRAIRQALVQTAPVSMIEEVSAPYQGRPDMKNIQSRIRTGEEQGELEMRVITGENEAVSVVASLPVLRVLGRR
jgi:DNA mismatch repair protein MutL